MTDEHTGLTSLVYTSTASAPFRQTALAHLLDDSRSRNSARHITGMLLYRGERFIQVLEGPTDLVRRLAARIGQDPRHQDMRVLIDEPIESRQFTEWTMGYHALGGAEAAPDGFRDSFADLDDGESDATMLRALRELTLWFRVRSGALAPTNHG